MIEWGRWLLWEGSTAERPGQPSLGMTLEFTVRVWGVQSGHTWVVVWITVRHAALTEGSLTTRLTEQNSAVVPAGALRGGWLDSQGGG